MNAGCAGKTVLLLPLCNVRIPVKISYYSFWERVADLSALEVSSRQGATQIHVYLTFPYRDASHRRGLWKQSRHIGQLQWALMLHLSISSVL